MAMRRTEGIGSALAAVVWSRPQYVTLPARGGGLGNGPDPLKILVVRRCDGACASMALPPPVRAAFAGLERNVVLQHAPALQACVGLGLSGLVLRPGDRKTLAAVTYGPARAVLGTLRVFGGGVGYDLCEVDLSAVPYAGA
jgi:hypothetical protein